MFKKIFSMSLIVMMVFSCYPEVMGATDSTTSMNLDQPIQNELLSQVAFDSKIMDAKNGATSIVTITMDDGITDALQKCNSWFSLYGLKGSSVIWSDRASSSVDTYRNYYNKGFIDVTSHSKTHGILSDTTTDTQRVAEIQGSRDTLKTLFPDQEVLTFAPSNNKVDATSATMLPSYYWATRQGKRGYNSLNPPNTGIGGWYDLKIQGSYNPQDESGVAWTLDDCLTFVATNPRWLIEMYHGIGSGTLPVADSTAKLHFEKMGQMQKDGQIWVATFNEATKYIRERQNTTIADVTTATERTVTLTMNTQVLPADLFDYPLTVRSQVSADWAKTGVYVKITQGGAIQYPKVKNIDGSFFVDYDAVPTKGAVKLESTTSKPTVPVTEVRISSEGLLTQDAGVMQPVTFTASTIPVDDTDTSGIEWYVNDKKQTSVADGSLSFSFATQEVGVYNIYAKDSLMGIVSTPITVTVKEAGLLFKDDFEGYGDEAVLPSTNWYSNIPIGLEEYPLGSGNHAAASSYDLASKYPGMHKTVEMAVGVPTIFSGNIALVGNTQAYFLEIRNSVAITTGNRKLVFKVKNGVISAVDETLPIGSIENGKWLQYSVCIIPGAQGSTSKLRVSLSSPYLSGPNKENLGKPISFETDVNLDNIGIEANSKANMVHNNDFSKSDATCKNYLDNVKIYNPKQAFLIAPNDAVALNSNVQINLNKDVYGFEPSMVTVTKQDGESVAIKSLEFDPLYPRLFKLNFAQGVLEKSTNYTVILNGGTMLKDAAGYEFSGLVQFTTSSVTEQYDTFTVADSYFTADGNKTETISSTQKSISAIVVVDKNNVLTTKKIDVIIAMYGTNGVARNMWKGSLDVVAGSGEQRLALPIDLPESIVGCKFKLFVWDSLPTINPLTDLVPITVVN